MLPHVFRQTTIFLSANEALPSAERSRAHILCMPRRELALFAQIRGVEDRRNRHLPRVLVTILREKAATRTRFSRETKANFRLSTAGHRLNPQLPHNEHL